MVRQGKEKPQPIESPKLAILMTAAANEIILRSIAFDFAVAPGLGPENRRASAKPATAQ